MRPGDVRAIVLLVAILAALIFGVVEIRSPIIGKPTSWGFGPEWDCVNPGKGDPVCVKKVEPKPAN